MKLLGIDTSNVRLLGKFTFTNNTEFPIVVSLWQTGPLYYRVVDPEQTWSTDCGSVWFTVRVWLFNGENNINPGIKYSLLAGNIVGFAALGAIGLTATALASSYGVSMRNPDWEEWLIYNNLSQNLSEGQNELGIACIKQCEYSQTGVYAGKHPHLYVSGGPVQRERKSELGFSTTLEWHELRIDTCPYANDSTPLIRPNFVIDPEMTKIADRPPPMPNRPREVMSSSSLLSPSTSILDNTEDGKQPKPTERAPLLPERPNKAAESEEKYTYKIDLEH